MCSVKQYSIVEWKTVKEMEECLNYYAQKGWDVVNFTTECSPLGQARTYIALLCKNYLESVE